MAMQQQQQPLSFIGAKRIQSFGDAVRKVGREKAKMSPHDPLLPGCRNDIRTVVEHNQPGLCADKTRLSLFVNSQNFRKNPGKREL